MTITAHKKSATKVGGTTIPLIKNNMRSFSMGMSDKALWINQYKKKERSPAEVMPVFSGRWFGKLMKDGQMASIQRWRKAPAWTVRIAVHIIATNAVVGQYCDTSRKSVVCLGYSPLMQIAGNEPYMPKTLRTATGKGMLYLAPILPVRVMTTLQMANPKKTIGIVSRAVNPRAMTEDTVEAKGGASMSEHLNKEEVQSDQSLQQWYSTLSYQYAQ